MNIPCKFVLGSFQKWDHNHPLFHSFLQTLSAMRQSMLWEVWRQLHLKKYKRSNCIFILCTRLRFWCEILASMSMRAVGLASSSLLTDILRSRSSSYNWVILGNLGDMLLLLLLTAGASSSNGGYDGGAGLTLKILQNLICTLKFLSTPLVKQRVHFPCWAF